jgi:hypothetical protein
MLLLLPFDHVHLASLLSLPILHPSPRLAAMAQPPTFFDGAHHLRMDRTTIYSIARNHYNVNVSNVQMDGKPSSQGLFSDCLLMQSI